MDDETQRKPEFYSEGSFDEVRSPLNQYAGAFFAQAKDFVINGGRFKSVTNIYRAAANDPTHFRMIPLGDLNLLHGTGHGNASSVEWRKDILQYSVLRHPNLPQLYGIVNSGRLHAAIFHDALIPYTHVQRKYRNSHFSTMFFAACMDRKFFDISQYTISLNSHQLHWSECTPWIRSSTGSLCFQLIPPQSDPARLYSVDGVKSLATDTSLFELPEDPQIITSMSLQEYHRICYMYMCQWHDVSVSTYVPIKLRTPVCGIVDMGWLAFSFGREGGDSDFVFPASYTSLTIAPNASIVRSQEGITTMGNGWIRINSANVADQYYRRIENDSVGIPWVDAIAPVEEGDTSGCYSDSDDVDHFKSEDELSEEESSSTESETEIHLEPQFRANNVANASHEHFEKTSASHGFDEQILTPTMGWNIIMSVQFALLFAVSALWLYEYLRHW
ncbi:hypothetical protein MVEN_02554000 [Mycena venus]|uniref:Uncharacterized protein n=1 Tax=Mycena venus TaxID=2733690 RepID=A0A8H6U3P6_9AGAR|nr:hypothetical protein MVEN_02554000 [Mycena venus]